MTKPAIIKEEPMSIPEVKGALDAIKARDKALTFRGNKADEYVSQFSVIDAKKAAELAEKIMKLNIPRLREQHIKKIIDVMPIKAKDVRVVLQGYVITVKPEHLQKIAETVAEFIPKK